MPLRFCLKGAEQWREQRRMTDYIMAKKLRMSTKKPRVRIPLPFGRAVEGLLAVPVKKKAKRKKPGPKASG
jgi:hypothetical protein